MISGNEGFYIGESADDSVYYDSPLESLIAVLICGKAGVGKTTFAKYLKSNLDDHRIRSVIVPMASALKKIATEQFGWDGFKDAKGRRLLQVIGTEAGREYYEDIWVEKAVEWFMRGKFSNFCNVMISDDVRFDNEITYCEGLFDHVIPLSIEGPSYWPLPPGTENHASENSLTFTDFCGIIDNTGRLIDLESQSKFWSNIVKEELCGYEYN